MSVDSIFTDLSTLFTAESTAAAIVVEDGLLKNCLNALLLLLVPERRVSFLV